MNKVKRILGIIWMILAPAIIYFLVDRAIVHIDPAGKKDINNPVIWIIIITIFTPIAVGLVIFGWYAFKGAYDHLPENSAEVDN